MLLELCKGVTFVLSILSLYRVGIAAFFLPATRWRERFWLMMPNVAITICMCLVAGMVFRWPARSNPEAGKPLLSSLPVQMMVWALPGLLLLFGVGWYLVCGNPLRSSFYCG